MSGRQYLTYEQRERQCRGGAVDRRRNQTPSEANGRQHRRIVADALDRRQLTRPSAVNFHDRHDCREAASAMEVSSAVA